MKTHQATSHKVLAFDLDGTLASSKSAITPDMADVLCQLLKHVYIAIISGASVEQMKTQVAEKLPCKSASAGAEQMSKLLLFPENGDALYIWNDEKKEYAREYEDLLSSHEKSLIMKALSPMFSRFNIPVKGEYGDIIEDRGGQITFSALGQKAPIEKKETWDPDQKIRKEMKVILDEQLPDFEVRIGGTTSIDITRKGVSKAYALRKLFGYLAITAKEGLFFGDALFEGGNDAPARETGIECVQVSNPQDTMERLRVILNIYEEDTRA